MRIDRARYNELYGPTAGDQVRLGDTDLWVTVPVDDVKYGDELLSGAGKTVRDGLLSMPRPAGDSALDMVVTGVLLIDPVLGVRKTSIGVKDGRIAAIGRAGNPDHGDPVDLVVDSHTSIVPGEGLIATPGAIDTHAHLSSPALVPTALSAGVTTMGAAMGLGGVWEIGVNPKHNAHILFEAWRGVPMNVGFLARGSSVSTELHERAVMWGASGYKIHEDFGATPDIIDACLRVAEQADLPVALHTDSLNESGSLQDTVDATRGRAVHAFHIEGGGGHPNLMEILTAPNILGSSTTPTLPYTANTVTELVPMTMTVHRGHPGIESDRQIVAGRIRERAIAAENVLHDLGAISIINSDCMGMGRISEMVRRTFQLAHLAARHAGETGPGVDNTERVLRFLAKLTVNPAITHGMAHEIGSLQPGRLADIVLWHPAWFGTKPELVLKSGFAVYGNIGSASGSTRLGEPRRYQPYWGSLGGAPARLAKVFVAQQVLDDSTARRELPDGLSYAAVKGSRGLTRAAMVRNDYVPASVHVPRDDQPVTVDGKPIGLPPATNVPLGMLHHFA